MKDVDTIINEIISKEHKILNEIQQESIDVYIFILEQYKRGDILKNCVFQFIFRSYYRLDNAGLSSGQKARFFKMLSLKQRSLSKILEELYKIQTLKYKNTIQFSFATKLLNMLDANSPIFDSQVANVIGQRVTGKTKEEKIKSCEKIFEYLTILYKDLLSDKRIKLIIRKCKNKYDKKNKCSDVKILDFILWSLGKINLLKNNHAKIK